MQVLGLPGNPVSAFVCALLFLVPLIRRLAGRADVEPQTESAKLGVDLPANDERADYMRATLSAGSDGTLVATPIPGAGFLDDGGARKRRLPRHSRAICPSR